MSTSTKGLAVLVAVLLLAGCGASTPQPAEPPQATAAPPAPVAAPVDTLNPSFAELSATIPAAVGVSVVSGSAARTFGEWTQGVAWSTIKVPLSIAALRGAPQAAPGPMSRAIIQSDNEAAEQLWSMLGDPAQAAEAVQAVLREGGDATTTVQAQRVREGYTAFGQTDWPVEAQARFAANLPCLVDAETVIADMHRLDGEQQWGLAGDDGVAAKGGWGPGADGSYLVRQLAVLSSPTGNLGVALAAQAEDGSYPSAVAAVNRLADWVRQHQAEFPATPC